MKYFFMSLLLIQSTFASSSFVEKFFYQVEGSCRKPESIVFYQAKTVEAAKLGTNPAGLKKEAYLSLQLFPDQTYWAVYGERVIKDIVEGGIIYGYVFEKRNLNGRWVLDGQVLQLENLGTAVASKYEAFINRPYPSLKVTLTNVFNDEAALNQKFNLVMGMTDEGPRGQYVYQYCQL